MYTVENHKSGLLIRSTCHEQRRGTFNNKNGVAVPFSFFFFFFFSHCLCGSFADRELARQRHIRWYRWTIQKGEMDTRGGSIARKMINWMSSETSAFRDVDFVCREVLKALAVTGGETSRIVVDDVPRFKTRLIQSSFLAATVRGRGVVPPDPPEHTS